MILDMLLDNIALRLWVNDLMQHQVYATQKKLDRHAQNQVVRDVDPYGPKRGGGQKEPQEQGRRPQTGSAVSHKQNKPSTITEKMRSREGQETPGEGSNRKPRQKGAHRPTPM